MNENGTNLATSKALVRFSPFNAAFSSISMIVGIFLPTLIWSLLTAYFAHYFIPKMPGNTISDFLAILTEFNPYSYAIKGIVFYLVVFVLSKSFQSNNRISFIPSILTGCIYTICTEFTGLYSQPTISRFAFAIDISTFLLLALIASSICINKIFPSHQSPAPHDLKPK